VSQLGEMEYDLQLVSQKSKRRGVTVMKTLPAWIQQQINLKQKTDLVHQLPPTGRELLPYQEVVVAVVAGLLRQHHVDDDKPRLQ